MSFCWSFGSSPLPMSSWCAWAAAALSLGFAAARISYADTYWPYFKPAIPSDIHVSGQCSAVVVPCSTCHQERDFAAVPVVLLPLLDILLSRVPHKRLAEQRTEEDWENARAQRPLGGH